MFFLFLPALAAGDTLKLFWSLGCHLLPQRRSHPKGLKVSVPSAFKCQEEMAETNQSFGVEKRKRDNFFSVDFSTFREM